MTAVASNRRSRYWRLAARGLAWSLVLLALVTLGVWIFVDSGWVRERARRAVVTQASDYLEREVRVERLDFDLFPPRVTLEGIAIAGAASGLPPAGPSADPSGGASAAGESGAVASQPLLTARRVTVGFGPGLIEALRGHGVIDLRSIDVAEPHLRLEVAEDGTTNLPPVLERIGRDEDRGGAGIEVRLGALYVAGGRLDLDERSLPLDLEAAGVRAVLGRLAGTDEAFRLQLESRRVAVRRPAPGSDAALDPSGDLSAGERPPLEVRLELQADLLDGAVEVSRLHLAGELVDLEASGDYRDRRLEATASGRLDLAVLESVGWADDLEALGGRPVGSLSIDGRFRFEDGRWSATSDVATTPITAGTRRLAPLTAALEASGEGARVDALVADLRGRSLEVELTGSSADGRLEIDARGWADGGLAAELDLVDGLEGRVAFDGRLELGIGSGGGAWELTADLASEELRYGTYVVRRASTRLGATPAAVRAESIEAVVVGGSVGGSVTVDLERPAERARPTGGPAPTSVAEVGSPAAPAGRLSAAALAASYPAASFPVVSLDLAVEEVDVRRFVEMAELPVEGLGGRASGELLYVFASQRPAAGRGRGLLAFERLDVDPPSVEDRRPIELAGRVPFEIDAGVFRVAAAELRAPEQQVTLSGRLDLDPPAGAGPRVEAEFALDTGDPRRLLRLLPALYETDPEPIWEPQRGRGTVEGRLVADPEGFSIALDLDLAEVAVAATEADRLSGTLSVDSGGVQSVDLELLRGLHTADAALEREPAWDGRLEVKASVPFDDPPPGYAAPPFEVALATSGWPLADAAPWLPFELPADGLADATVELSGDLEAMSGRVEGSVAEVVLAGTEVAGTLSGALSFTPAELTIEHAALEMPAGRLELGGTYGLDTEALDLEISSTGLDLERPPFGDWVEAPLAGSLTLAAELGGTLSEPSVVAELVGRELVLGDSDLGRAGESRLDLVWRDGELTARGSVLGLVRLDGGGRLDASRADVSVAVASDQVGRLLEIALGGEIEGTSGELRGNLTVAGPADALDVRLTLDRLTLEQPDRRLANLEPVVVAWRDGVLSLESLFMGEEGAASELFVAGTLVGPEGGLDLVVQSSVDARWLALYLPDVTLTGQINVLGVVRGSLADPTLDGQADLAGARMIVAGFPHAFERMSGLVFFYPDRIVIDSGTARLAGGRVRADGVLDTDEEGQWGFEMRFRGDDLDLRYPEDWRLQGNAELTLAGTAGGRELTGVVTLERAEYQRDFKLGLMGLLRTLFERRAETVRETDELLVDTKLNILVEGAEALYIETNLADVQGSLDFSVRGSLAEPVLLGDVRLLRGGEIDIGGANYIVERGTLSFSNPFRNAPRLDLVASAQVKEYDVRLNIYGPLENLQTTFSSNPPLADVDIVSLLATGSTDTLSSLGSGGLVSDPTSSAESFLAGQAASLAGERVGTLLGLDKVQISPLTGGTTDLSTARFTVGKRLGQDLFVTYSYDPSRSREEIYELSWQIYPSLALILTRSDEGSFAVDLEWNTTF